MVAWTWIGQVEWDDARIAVFSSALPFSQKVSPMPRLISLGSWYFDLDCGRHVEVSACHCKQTYLGLLEGTPTASLDRQIIEEAETGMVPIWGQRKTHVILPPDFGKRSMPFLQFAVWLTCNHPIHPDNAGSELVVIWFRTDVTEASMDQIVGDAIQSLPWDELAQDFEGM